ncbi:4-(cytidine 5'-diphospho)-2-C-methyl-D-erythritol kinase [Flaviflexus huanghaiensis]|uniref:4-(cytidine 5'-diphospho)-2-C-methyl-D-erythritol kinase n=1 Tax=Flaviflexus huanghaiensis TaxID=1111473 RepID=UPI0015FA0277|nr:4-(cytidine 5'-diphospho)-2-C-methyl-D-erythritol kinase [Flaviflexus huanghaiensis]
MAIGPEGPAETPHIAYPDEVHTVHAQAPAKINLALRVGGPRSDGFHPLQTVFCALDLWDAIVVKPAEGLSLTITGIELEVDDNNLALKAARALQSHTGTSRGADIAIHKGIPVAGGLAGGSADAAGTLVALNALWGLDLPREELHELAAELGSDVPFMLMGGLALGVSRGEDLHAIKPGAFQSWVLVLDDEGLSTPAVFRRYDELKPEPHAPADVDELMSALRSPSVTNLAGLLMNDLEEPAFTLRPDLKERFDRVAGTGVATVLSGSGPTIGVLCESVAAADSLAKQLTSEGLRAVRADGPAAGAHIVRSS